MKQFHLVTTLLFLVWFAGCGSGVEEEAMVEENQSNISADFPFESHYLEVEGSNLHYIDLGTGDPVLFLHGNPTWSYLWRNIIPHVTPVSRAVAVDLIGMGKSDKPDIEYRFLEHSRYLESFIEKMELKNITLVMHDWGAALGFYYAMRHEENVKGLAFMEPAGFRATPSWDVYSESKRKLFQSYRHPETGWDLLVNQNDFIETRLPGNIVRKLSEEEMNNYRAPFTDPSTRKPVWRWPNEIPIAGEPPDMVELVNEYNGWLQQSDLPKLLFHASPGRIVTPRLLEWCQAHLKNLQLVHIGEGLHFLQEDNPDVIGSELANWYGTLPN